LGNADSVSAVLWKKGGQIVDLNTLVEPGTGLALYWSRFINDRGEIAAYGVSGK
jgi:hypothetical protein